MRLTADRLQLFHMTGRGVAANAISSAVTTATKQAIRTIGRRYDRERAIRAVSDALIEHVYPVCYKHAGVGASDSEPFRAVKSEIVNRISNRYGNDGWESDALYWEL